jgi:hypothetical protein
LGHNQKGKRIKHWPSGLVGLKLKKMENRSRHYGDVVKWVEKVIDSCETYQQILTAKMLIHNFDKQMYRNKLNISLIWSIRSSLDLSLSFKRNEIMGK